MPTRSPTRDLLKVKPKKAHPLRWVVESLEDEPSFIAKPMFGCIGCYLFGRLVLVLAARGRAPWMGLLVPTERKHHASLRRDHPGLITHPVLKKWLYLPESNEHFEEIAHALVDATRANDRRLGVDPKARSRPGGRK